MDLLPKFTLYIYFTGQIVDALRYCESIYIYVLIFLKFIELQFAPDLEKHYHPMHRNFHQDIFVYKIVVPIYPYAATYSIFKLKHEPEIIGYMPFSSIKIDLKYIAQLRIG